jgi:hypothetical protein
MSGKTAAEAVNAHLVVDFRVFVRRGKYQLGAPADFSLCLRFYFNRTSVAP